MDILNDIVFNPFLVGFVILIVCYVFLVLLVNMTGSPKFARRMPIAKRFFPVRIRVWEARKNGYFPIDTLGRRFKMKDGKELYQTIGYGDIIPPKLDSIYMAAKGNILEFVLSEDGEFHPITIQKGNLGYEYAPQTQEQKAIWRIEWEDGRVKYQKEQSLWGKLVPYIPLILIIFAVFISLKIIMDGFTVYGAQLKDSSMMLADALKYAKVGIGPVTGNYSY